MYKVVQVGKKFIIRRADRKIESPSQSPRILRVVQSFWTGSGWSSDRTQAKEFESLLDAAVCHPPE